MREGMADLIEAAVKNDTGNMIEAARKMGFIAAGRDAEDLAEQMIIALRSFIQHEVKIDSLNFKDIQIDPFNNSLFHLVQQIGLSGITRTVQVPREFVLLNRMLTLLLGITASLSPRYNPLGVIRPYMQEFVLGSRGSLQEFISQLLRSTLTNTLALPEEITQTLRQLKRDKISIRTPDQLTAARIIYEGLHQLALVALATLTWLYAPATTWYLREALLLLWVWLAWRSVLRVRNENR
jgi:predicted unusual protein kinase regulating ubiquinone biosynthesis (AarF/ABC1/UbiB family)